MRKPSIGTLHAPTRRGVLEIAGRLDATRPRGTGSEGQRIRRGTSPAQLAPDIESEVHASCSPGSTRRGAT
jgi:hypothetical protein